VTSRIDSRTIIDSQGAEQLLGKGDMLLMLPGKRIERVHGALVTEEEVRAVTGFITSQGTPDYSLFETIASEVAGQEEASDERDEMYQKVLEFGEYTGEVSISSIQRRFKIGYNRAARLWSFWKKMVMWDHQEGRKTEGFLEEKEMNRAAEWISMSFLNL